MADFIIVQTTTETAEDAKSLAKILVEASLCKCAQIAKIESMYVWDGKFCQADEYSLSLKAHVNSFDEIAKIIKANHKYEVPEIIATPILAIGMDYLAWLEE